MKPDRDSSAIGFSVYWHFNVIYDSAKNEGYIMKSSRRIITLAISTAVLAAVSTLLWLTMRGSPSEEGDMPSKQLEGNTVRKSDSPKKPSRIAPYTSADKGNGKRDGTEMPEGNMANQGETENAENEEKSEEEKVVDAFDAETDKWMETEGRQPPTMKDVDEFVAKFRKIPKERKEECLHRALNLVPDENVMLLAGILMDKTEDKSLVELVYNDILNRDENVKKPILQQIFKDRSHPCWVDTAWILDVTGEMPK